MPSPLHTVWHDCPAGHDPAKQKAPPALSQVGVGPTQEQPDASGWQLCPPGQAAGGVQVCPQRWMVVVVQRLSGRVVLVVVVVGEGAGAQSSFAVVGTTARLPN